MGPLGIVVEVTPEGKEVWRYLNPVENKASDGVAFVRQGESRLAGGFGLFRVTKYPATYLTEHAEMLKSMSKSARYLEA